MAKADSFQGQMALKTPTGGMEALQEVDLVLFVVLVEQAEELEEAPKSKMERVVYIPLNKSRSLKNVSKVITTRSK